jgi:hypothetical protein
MTPRELAAEHAARRRARLARIRRTVAAVGVCVFIALFSGIYVQMAAGRDPVLGSKTTVTKKASTPTSTSTSSDGNAAGSAGDDSSSFSTGSDDSSSTSSQPSAVTTSQS